MQKHNILIVHKNLGFPLRNTIIEHLYSFRQYSHHRCFYLDVDADSAPLHLKYLKYDLIIFHYGFISARWGGHEYLIEAMRKINWLKDIKCLKAVMPQDEYRNNTSIVTFINDFNIDIIYSVAPESEWHKIYEGVNFERVRFYKTLTGFVNDTTVSKISHIQKEEGIDRDIDIGYRARNMPPWLGKHGYLKTQIGEIFATESPKHSLKIDISTQAKDTFFGDDWYRFMLRCKYFIGVEGGSTVLDKYGNIGEQCEVYYAQNPTASFEELEEKFFPDLDGKLNLIAISPRQFELCMTRTCQVLVEGDYNGILKPNVHYIPVKKDMSNLEDVFSIIQKDEIRSKMVERAYNDIVLSGNYSYQKFVDFVFKTAFENITVETKSNLVSNLAFSWNKNIEKWWWYHKKIRYLLYGVSFQYKSNFIFIEMLRLLGIISLKRKLTKLLT